LLRLVQADATDPYAPNFLSAILTREGNHPQALFYAQRAAALAPDEPPLLVTLGNLLSLNGRYEEAKAVLRRAITLASARATGAAPDPAPWLALAQAYLGAKDIAGALGVCEEAERGAEPGGGTG